MRKKLNILKKILIILLCCLLILFIGDKVFGNKTFYRFHNTTIKSDKLADEFDGFTIAFISDLNISDKYDLVRAETAIADLNKKEVDMILFGGDIYDSSPFSEDKVINLLKSIHSKYGKFAVLGDKDQKDIKTCQSILNEAGFEILHNEYRPIYYINEKAFALFGLEHSGDVSGLISKANKDMFKLVFVHQPDYFTKTKKSKIDLQLSGHTLGGYYYIPIYGGVIKTELGSKYTKGRYKDKNTKSQLIVSSGFNKEANQKYRIFTSDEINIIKFKK